MPMVGPSVQTRNAEIESGEVRPEPIRHALETARKKNLPPNEPGIVFVKVPQKWLEYADVRHGLVDVATHFLRNTKRIVLVTLYCSVQFPAPGQQLMVLRHLQEEVENSNHRFDMTKSWRLFKGLKSRLAGMECRLSGIAFFQRAATIPPIHPTARGSLPHDPDGSSEVTFDLDRLAATWRDALEGHG